MIPDMKTHFLSQSNAPRRGQVQRIRGVSRGPIVFGTMLAQHFQLSLDGSTLIQGWLRKRPSNYCLEVSTTRDAGNRWAEPFRVVDSISRLTEFELAVSSTGETQVITWISPIGNGDAVYARISTDAGRRWGRSIRLANTFRRAYSLQAAASSDGSTVAVTWLQTNSRGAAVVMSMSTENIESWCTPVRLSNPLRRAHSLQIATGAKDATTIVTWIEQGSARNAFHMAAYKYGPERRTR